MNNKDWYDYGAKIGDLVQKAIDNNDFRQLSQSIADTLNEAADDAGKRLRESASQAYQRNGGRQEYRNAGNAYRQAKTRAGVRDDVVFDKNVKGIAKMAFGYGTSFFFAVGALVMGILAAALHVGFFALLAAMLLAVAIVFGYMGHKGVQSRERLRRMKRYLRIMGKRDTVSLTELAAATGQKQEDVLEDLQELISEGAFSGPAYLDAQGTTFMTSYEAYKQYMATATAYEQRKAEEQRAAQEAARQAAKDARQAAHTAEENANLSEETRKILEEGRAFIAHIHEKNDEIHDESLTEKLNRLEFVVTRIFDSVERDPDSAPDLHRMMSYYLPITQKLVDAYAQLDPQASENSNAGRTRKEIEQSLDTVNAAFETLLDSFFEETAWDISSDITALKTMMARDGLTKRDFAPGEHIKSVGNDFKTGQAAAGAAAMMPEGDKEEE